MIMSRRQAHAATAVWREARERRSAPPLRTPQAAFARELLRRSDDGGRTFRRLRLPRYHDDYNCGPVLADIAFPTQEVGFVVTSDGTVLRTLDGGRQFSRLGLIAREIGSTISSSDLEIASTDAQTGVAAAGRHIYRTANAARSWSQAAELRAEIHDIVMASPSVGYAVGARGLVARTTDGGATWHTHQIEVTDEGTDAGNGRLTLDLWQIACANQHLCTALADDRLVRFTDEGSAVTIVVGGILTDVEFRSPTSAP
jgi:photosystem II stability/assembly factor-like uncharacterized protein